MVSLRLDVVSCMVIVVVLWARELPMFWAFRRAEEGMGEPASWQASWRGVRRRLLSRLLSHWACTVGVSGEVGYGREIGKVNGGEGRTACYCVGEEVS